MMMWRVYLILAFEVGWDNMEGDRSLFWVGGGCPGGLGQFSLQGTFPHVYSTFGFGFDLFL